MSAVLSLQIASVDDVNHKIRLYLRRYCGLRSISPEDVKVWMLPMAARLSQGIAEEEQQLMSLVKTLLAQASA
jgi:hypothetical protein